jgi:hypothetical protein
MIFKISGLLALVLLSFICYTLTIELPRYHLLMSLYAFVSSFLYVYIWIPTIITTSDDGHVCARIALHHDIRPCRAHLSRSTILYLL